MFPPLKPCGRRRWCPGFREVRTATVLGFAVIHLSKDGESLRLTRLTHANRPVRRVHSDDFQSAFPALSPLPFLKDRGGLFRHGSAAALLAGRRTSALSERGSDGGLTSPRRCPMVERVDRSVSGARRSPLLRKRSGRDMSGLAVLHEKRDDFGAYIVRSLVDIYPYPGPISETPKTGHIIVR